MNNIDFKIIKDDEFAVLCVLSGINKFFGAIDIDYSKLNKQSIYSIVYRLLNKSLVIYKGDGIELAENIKEIFDELKSVTHMMSFIDKENNSNQMFYYNSTQIASINIEKRWEDPKSIWIRKVNKEDIIEICYEAQLIPDIAELMYIKPEKKDNIVEITQLSNLNISLYDVRTEVKCREIEFEIKGLDLEIIVKEDNKEMYKDIYSKEALITLIISLIGV